MICPSKNLGPVRLDFVSSWFVRGFCPLNVEKAIKVVYCGQKPVTTRK